MLPWDPDQHALPDSYLQNEENHTYLRIFSRDFLITTEEELSTTEENCIALHSPVTHP